jgi:hypothetical protein
MSLRAGHDLPYRERRKGDLWQSCSTRRRCRWTATSPDQAEMCPGWHRPAPARPMEAHQRPPTSESARRSAAGRLPGIRRASCVGHRPPGGELTGELRSSPCSCVSRSPCRPWPCSPRRSPPDSCCRRPTDGHCLYAVGFLGLTLAQIALGIAQVKNLHVPLGVLMFGLSRLQLNGIWPRRPRPRRVELLGPGIVPEDYRPSWLRLP